MRIDINVATHPFVNRLPHAMLLGGLLALAVALTTWNAAQFLGTRTEARAVERELGEIATQREELKVRHTALLRRLRDADLGVLAADVEAANSVLSEKSLAWSLLLQRLAEVLPWSTALRSVRTSTGERGVTLNVELRAKNMDFYLDFVDALETSPCFANVYPSTDIPTTTGEFEATVQLEYDPQCGTGPAEPPRKLGTGARGRTTRATTGGRRRG
jgi:Tfp pilus assembly protein PilN